MANAIIIKVIICRVVNFWFPRDRQRNRRPSSKRRVHRVAPLVFFCFIDTFRIESVSTPEVGQVEKVRVIPLSRVPTRFLS